MGGDDTGSDTRLDGYKYVVSGYYFRLNSGREESVDKGGGVRF
jgi:hypothetical protein